MDFVSPWMDKIRTTCQRAEIDHIDVIIDQCAVNFSVLPALTTFSNPMMWQSLYQGLPEDIILRMRLCWFGWIYRTLNMFSG